MDCDVFVILDSVSVIIDGGLSWHNHMILVLCFEREKGRKRERRRERRKERFQ